MRLAVYCPWIHLTGGIERTLLELMKRSRHDVTIYTHRFRPELTYAELRSERLVEFQPAVSVERSMTPLVGAAWRIGRTQLTEREADALLVSSNDLGDLIMARTRLPAACYCWTPLKILHDPASREGLRRRDKRKSQLLSILGPALDAVDRRMWRRYDHAFVCSGEVLRRVENARLVPSGPTEVLHPGVDFDWFFDDGGPREDFLLVAGRIKWWKNIDLAIAALREANRRGDKSSLVITGNVDPVGDDYLRSLREQAQGLPVRFETEPSQERLRELLRRCRALVFPTLNEDFGMVPLEAMACGAPVIAVNAGGPRESVVPGETGWLVPPTPEAFADAILDATSARAAEMRAAARARAEQFSWDRFVARIDDVMDEVVDRRQRARVSG
ncbi:MAG TPA: glycosyltransferase family 4 protein [Actinomycetota bacterium]|nr:glycosyltransferase family 4 protein [Actinomycetota bacterium]